MSSLQLCLPFIELAARQTFLYDNLLLKIDIGITTMEINPFVDKIYLWIDLLYISKLC